MLIPYFPIMETGENMKLKPALTDVSMRATLGSEARGETEVEENWKTMGDLLDGVLTRLGNRISEPKKTPGAEESATRGKVHEALRTHGRCEPPYIATSKPDSARSRK
jgi:hypothetical protein